MKSFDKEVNRIKDVYESYLSNDKKYSKWSLDNYGNKYMIEEKFRVSKDLLKKYGSVRKAIQSKG